MGNRATDIIDEFIGLVIKMSILILIFFSNLFDRIVEFSNIGTSNLSLFFDKLGQLFLE